MILSSFQKYNNSYIKINNEFSSVSNLSAAIILKELLKHKSNKEKRKKIAEYWKKEIIDKDINLITPENTIYNKLYVKSSKEIKRNFIANGIQVEDGYKPLHLRYDFSKYPRDDLKYTMKVWRHIYSLPTRPSYNII